MNSASPSKKFWRSLDELAGTAAFQQRLPNEFPSESLALKSFDRRNFLKLMGASLALASLPACTRQPVERIVPYVDQPEQLIPGKPLHFATAMTIGGFATGLLVESHEGHPTKIEGNPSHPASLGATSAFHQAALLDLYDPYRSKEILCDGRPGTWNNFLAALKGSLQTQTGKRLRILTETITSPTLHSQIQSLLKQFPNARWHQYEPANRDNTKKGATLAFGRVLETHYHFEQANVILSLDSDFLYFHPDILRYTRQFADGRRARLPKSEMNRLYVVEDSVSVTGANADHRLPLEYSKILTFALRLARYLTVIPDAGQLSVNLPHEEWVSAIAQDLLQNRGHSIVIVGDSQPPIVHAIAHLLNHFLKNAGVTVTYSDSAEAEPVVQLSSLRELHEALINHEVDALVVLGGNPAFNAPVDFNFGQAMGNAWLRVHLSRRVNETSKLCNWHIPENHFLESWSDARSFDGPVSIVQPLILPLYDGKSAHELLDAMVSSPGRSDYDIVHDYWKSNNAIADFEPRWRRALHDGWIQDSALPTKPASLQTFEIPAVKTDQEGSLEVTFEPDCTVFDGSFAGNTWLQELPKPVTKMVWDNAAYVSPDLARREQLSNSDIVEIAVQGRTLEVPVWIVPGQPKDTIGLQFGYGSDASPVEHKAGFNIYALRASDALWSSNQVSIKKTGRRYLLVTAQIQQSIDSEERQIFRQGTFEEFGEHPDFVRRNSESPSETLFDPREFKYDGYRWGMAIDLSACTGCNACVLACQSENNIPTVGKTEVSRGRIMHWIRVDSYFRGEPAQPEIYHQPVPCMHCENAPCELVCPVGATLHDKEGLNLQVYNRCVGTRYCSNNCPYKVRRFNFFQYADYKTPSLVPMRNPNVTVRWRGVMEKCTYCIQRISAARIESEKRGEKIQDGRLQTACQQVCPARAIVFGDLSNAESAVSKMKMHPLNFSMLGQLNTRPRTTYLAKLRNPNPLLSL